jgi:hypothetical protein
MGSLNGRVKRLEDRSRGNCPRCSAVVLYLDTDGEPTGAHQEEYREFEAGCPACGRTPPVIRVVFEDAPEV